MEDQKILYRSTRIIWMFFATIEILLLFRFALKLLGANEAAGFTEFIYSISAAFLAPFSYVFGTNAIGDSVFEWSTLLAMVVYWFIALGIIKLLAMSRDINSYEASRELKMQDNI